MRIFGMNIFNLKSINYHIKSLLLSPLPLRVNLLQLMMKRFMLGTFKQRLKYDGVTYTPYAYGMYSAALQAKSLGLKKITVIEFGVASGNGLIAMEKHGNEIKNLTGIDFEIYGFDTGKGLPKPTDYKDQCYFWKESDFIMDQKKLEKHLVFAKLIIGEIQDTIKHFIKDCLNSPIGFIAFDLDYYSSTIASFEIFNLNDNLLLPRVECYMDDIGSNELLVASKKTGVLKAIYDFNSASKEQKKILKKEGLKCSRIIPAFWNEQMYVFHSFYHYQYNHSVIEN
jgi:hypothetical protein